MAESEPVIMPEAAMIGPFIRYDNYDPATQEYTASVLVVTHPNVEGQPGLSYEAEEGSPEAAEGILLDTFEGFNFWRFNLSLHLSDSERRVPYTVGTDDNQGEYAFVVPGVDQPWHWAFWSCNGFHEPAEGAALDGIQPLWTDFNNQNSEKPFHVQVGGGDQLYNDPVWKIRTLMDWLQIDKDERITRDPDEGTTQETNAYYFAHYCEHYSEPQFKDALASVPYIFSWDDHDIFDGYGSYPPKLQYCPIFNMVFAAAKRFYLLFQQHATEETIRDLNGAWGGQGGYNEIKRLGSSVALWAMDNRTERTREQILAKETHDMGKEALQQLDEGVRHVILLATVPLVFPELPAEGAFEGIQTGQGFWGLFNKSGLGATLMNQFGEPDLLDDIIDHWTAKEHLEERRYLVQNMQDVAKSNKARVTFISGDVHSAGVGRFYSYPKKAGEDFREDFRFMANITSSAMGNTPMPAGLVATYNQTNRAGTFPGMEPTREKMVRRFRGGNDKVYGNRNYCTVEELPYDPSVDDINNGALNFSLRGEDRREAGKVDHWDNWVPVLTSVEDKWEGVQSTTEWAGTDGVGDARGEVPEPNSDDDEEAPASRDRCFKPPTTEGKRAKVKKLLTKLGGMLVKSALKKHSKGGHAGKAKHGGEHAGASHGGHGHGSESEGEGHGEGHKVGSGSGSEREGSGSGSERAGSGSESEAEEAEGSSSEAEASESASSEGSDGGDEE